ncbi:hypothetical protein B5F29_04065 [Lachnoclostridium sp. An196]|mgnify:FL=1|uniref:hypothetical protein n=1 Tax=Lachnoclostridium sp. An196 TaxID=1965583 RepID=UPI000B37AD5B|nr:hypothetical protein [Lachnoclostridium sp. An196]OUP21658.1 hypothetical protein B5F29_04065 [Lachnoclostridium sp. An196]
MKSRALGIILLAVVILASGGYYLYSSQSRVTVLDGYLGGEKIGLFEDEEAAEILRREYHLEFQYSRAGSLDMVTADQTGMDYLFPSSQTALAYYEDEKGQPVQDEIIFNTPIVLYTHQLVLDALMREGIVEEEEGVYYADMVKLTDLIMADTSWADLGVPELYGKVSVDTTDPAKSNSGNMFAALLANVLNGGETVDETTVENVIPKLQEIFARLGYMETSSSDLFNQFLRMGVGAKPMIAGYESQLLEFAVENPEDYEQMKDDLVMIYPSPTVWSTHVYIALDEAGRAGAEALLDRDIQKLAWEKHGFRTSTYGAASQSFEGIIEEMAPEVTRVMQVPDYPAMRRIIDSL